MSKLTRTDVTAVKLYEGCILAGIGSWLNVFDRASGKLMQKIQALSGQKVYGIIPYNNDVLVFGGKQFTVARREADGSFVTLFEAVVCNDWLHSGTWTADGHIALLTAHNVVQKWNILNKCVTTQYTSEDNSILYSGLLLPIQDDILVFCGTVFSEVLIHRCRNDTVLHRLKGHKGVIFSVSCSLQMGVIVTTSDDRSVRMWQLENTTNFLPESTDYWENVNITCIHELYGHSARVMKNCICDDFVVSIGEDSNICFWSYDGTLLRSVTAHLNACIWSLDADKDSLVTGGGDSNIILHPMSIVIEYGQNDIINIGTANPKKVVFTARRNIIYMTEKDDLLYYDTSTKALTTFNLKHKSTYKLLSISSCKQIIAVADMFGKLHIFIENCKGPPSITNLIDEELEIGKILFMQWVGNRQLVFSSENGAITVLASRDNSTEICANFVLPPCKERWLTSAAIDRSNNILVVGDRCGSIHVYTFGQKNPLKSFKKVHGRYGPTSITFRNNDLITTGRDGTLKYFTIDENWDVKVMCSQNLEFQWVEKFVDKDEHYICGFHERTFVVYNVRNNTKLLEVSCGGGHRSWDIIRYIDKVEDTYEEFIELIYLKNSNMNVETFQMSKIVSRNIVNGTHSKEINCLKTYVSKADSSTTFLISGGEDTSLRISRVNSDNDFHDEAIFKQLSSVRTLKLCAVENNKVLVISAGGRAQICIKILHFEEDDVIKVKTEELCDYLIKGTDKERKGNQSWRNCTIDIDPETRVMDLDVFESDESNFIIVAGCSDAYLRIFSFKYDEKNSVIKPLRDLKYHDTCVLKTHIFKFQNKRILISCTTRGIVTFSEINTCGLEDVALEPFKSLTIHQSGINSIAWTVVTDTSILLASGGDDNTIQLNVIEMNGPETAVKHNWSSNKLHCSQVTGIGFIDGYIVSTSIDQRVTVLQWRAVEGITCEFISQVFSDVADIQGLDVLKHDSESITVCVFGKGFEIISLPKHSPH